MIYRLLFIALSAFVACCAVITLAFYASTAQNGIDANASNLEIPTRIKCRLLKDNLKSNIRSVKCIAAYELGQMGKQAQEVVPLLKQLQRDSNEDAYLFELTGEAIEKITRTSVPQEQELQIHLLLNNIDSNEREVKLAAIKSLGNLGSKAAEVIPGLRTLRLRSSDDIVCIREIDIAIHSISGITGRPRDHDMSLLLDNLESDDIRIKWDAIHAAGCMGAVAIGVEGRLEDMYDEATDNQDEIMFKLLDIALHDIREKSGGRRTDYRGQVGESNDRWK